MQFIEFTRSNHFQGHIQYLNQFVLCRNKEAVAHSEPVIWCTWTGCNAVRELTHLGRKLFTLTFPINPSLDWTTSGRCFTFFLVEVKTSLHDIAMAFSDLAIQTEQDDTLNP